MRRWFRKTHGMTFQAYCRARRLGDAFVALRSGDAIDEVVFDHGWGSHSGFRTAFGKLAGAPPGEAAAAPDGSLIRLTWLETPVGPLVAGATDDALCLLEYPDRRMMETPARHPPPAVRPAARPRRQPALRAPARAAGRVLRRPAHAPSTSRSSTPGAPSSAASGTPCGASPTARRAPTPQLAREIGAPGAARAVGTANGANRIAIVIPCHRVIAADGGLGGYGGGLWRKLRLLELEGGRGARGAGRGPTPAPTGPRRDLARRAVCPRHAGGPIMRPRRRLADASRRRR